MRVSWKRGTRAVCAGLLLLALAGCGSQTETVVLDPTVTVETQTVSWDTLALDETYIATVSADGSASVFPKVSGVVSEVYVAVGDTVREGDVLCRFGDSSNASISQAQAQLSYRQLRDAKYPTAGISGTINDIYVKNGASVTAGEPIARIVSNTDVVVDFLFTYVSPSEFYAGQAADVLIDRFEGSVRGTVQSVSSDTTVTTDGKTACSVRVKINNPGNLIDAEAYTASAVIGSHFSYGKVPLSLVGANTVYAAGSGTITGFDKLIGSAVSAGEVLCTISSDALDTQIANAGLAVSSAGTALSNYTLTAPISGTVEEVNVTANNMAPSGAAFVISANGEKTATFYVTSEVAEAIQIGQAVTVESQGDIYQGAISEIGLAVDPATGLFKVKGVLRDALALANGKTVSLTTAARSVDHAALVPTDALYFEGGDAYVYVMRDGAAVRVNVDVGIYADTQAAVTGGLAEGDQIITTWSAGLKDGVPVRLADAEAPADAGTAR